jgi:ParB family transcriptional regulator, chromosome partitioning protein
MSKTKLGGALGAIGKQSPIIDTPQSSRLHITQITDRPGGDTRPLNPAHVDALLESIAAVGLIQPIAVDNQGRLLAGGHRRAALEMLLATDHQTYFQWFSDGVPVHRFDFDATQDEARALAIEASENEKRRDYTPGEVRELADRLVAAGYTNQRGGVKKGTKAVGPTLEIITGKSRRTIERYLASDTDKPKMNPSPVGFSKQAPTTAKAIQALIDCEDCPDDVRSDAQKWLKKLDDRSKS